MIYGLFGLPGSGKTYYAIKEFIVNRISTDTIISNIKLSDDIELPDNYRYLEKKDMDNLHKNIQRILEDATTSHDDKKHFLSYLFGMYGEGDITLIIDECHLYGYRGRSSSISYIDDFLSIHRHVFSDRKFDIVLITQVPTRLNTEIANQIEVAVSAISSSSRIISNILEYNIYTSVDAMRKRDKLQIMKKVFFRGDRDIFSLYQSGFVQKGSSDYRKKFLFIILGLFLVSFFIYYQYSNLSYSSSDDNSTSFLTLESNKTYYNFSYKIVCLTTNSYLDKKDIPNYLYTLISESSRSYCYKVFL